MNTTAAFHLIAKPSGPICNLDCHYCFYTEKESLFGGKPSFHMSDEVLEKFIKNYIHSQTIDEIPFVWQGGEPLLMGLDFYKKAIFFQQKYANGKKISNSLQTNGTLLNEEWVEFLVAHDFLIGLSLDGPEEIHDYYRVDRGGRPTFQKVYEAMKLLQKYNANFNILACVTRESAYKPLEIYDFFKSEGVKFIQFTPIVERTPTNYSEALGLRHGIPPKLDVVEESSLVTKWSVEPEKYGDFLITIFEKWVQEDVGDIVVMNFEHALVSWLGLPSTLCLFSETCGRAGMIEHNGDVYSCDHFMYPEYKLGNLFDESLPQMFDSQKQKDFGQQKKSTLPNECLQCEVRFACHGECPKHRFLTTEDNEPGLNYLCKGYKKYFNHIHRYMKVMVQLIEHGRPVHEIMDVIKGPLIIKN